MQKNPLHYGIAYQYDYTEKYDDKRNIETIVTIYSVNETFFEIGYTYYEEEHNYDVIHEKLINYFKDSEKLNKDKLNVQNEDY